MTENRIIELPGGNRYLPDYGYLTDHIKPEEDRSNPIHWQLQYQNPDAFSTSWKPRPGPLEFVLNLVGTRVGSDVKNPVKILNMGGGIGDFSIDLARLPYVEVTHVDYSEAANAVAKNLSHIAGVNGRLEIVTADDTAFLKNLVSGDRKVDVVFAYGNIGGNIPLESQNAEKVKLHMQAAKEGGFLWYVGLEQPFLADPNDTRAIDILGEYPTYPGLIDGIIEKNGSSIVKSIQEGRPDNHPLKPGEEIIAHIHIMRRALYLKSASLEGVYIPEFDFKNALNPYWPSIWSKLTK